MIDVPHDGDHRGTNRIIFRIVGIFLLCFCLLLKADDVGAESKFSADFFCSFDIQGLIN